MERVKRPGRIDGMLSHLHGLDEADIFGGEGVEGGKSSLQCRESLRQVPLTLILDGLGLCGCLIGHCLICSHHLEVRVLGEDITRDTACSLLHLLSLFHPLPSSA